MNQFFLTYRQNYLRRRCKFLCWRFPIPRPPKDFGCLIRCHAIGEMHFLLSREPHHRNCRWTFIIFSTMPIGIGNSDMKYRGRLDKDALTRVALPQSERRFPFQVANFLSILSMIGFHRLKWDELPPIWRRR